MIANFYDKRLQAVLRAEQRYRPLFGEALNLIPPRSAVVELGCGPGRFAKLLLASNRAASYTGLDFAPKTIKEAARFVGKDLFIVADLRTCQIPPADVYVSLEVLEHLDDDLGLLERLPEGSLVVLSVPSFPSESHVRWFPKDGDAAKRYGEILTLDHEQVVRLPSGAFFHLLRGTR